MKEDRTKWLVVQCAALGWNVLQDHPTLGGFDFSPLQPPTPGVTCTAQAEFRTGATAATHGMVANGLYHPSLKKPMFWEQAAAQVEGPRIWEDFRKKGGTVGMMFWQQSMGEDVDLVVSPRPIHKHSGGMIQACYTQPTSLEAWLHATVGKPFNLMHYWGPLASRKSTEWIVEATCAVMQEEDRCPDLLLTYLPHLDYDAQRHGPDHPKALKAVEELDAFLNQIRTTAEAMDRKVLVWGDYAMNKVTGPAIFPNRALRKAGLLDLQRVKKMAYPDLFSARAFAVVDHSIAHVHIPDEKDVDFAAMILNNEEGIEEIFRPSELPDLNHPNSGNLILFAKPGHWFAYPWWTDPKEAPDFATHVDIHNKPGFDPCELFFGKVPWKVSTDTSKVGGTHGHPGPGSETGWACTDPEIYFEHKTPHLYELARALQSRL